MERIKLALLSFFLIPLLLLASCAPSGTALYYQTLPFTARFALSTNGINLVGTIFAGSPSDSQGDVCISFEAPDALLGISVEQKSGYITTTLDGVSLTADSARWLAIAELFSLDGVVSSAKSTTLGGTPCSLVTVTAEDDEKYSIYIDKNGFPLRICGNIYGKPFVLDILFFRQDV